MTDVEPERGIWPGLLAYLGCGLLEVVGMLSTVLSLACCYLSFADLSPWAALAAGLGLWLLGSACLLTLRVGGRLDGRLLLLLWGPPSVAVWAELLRRGPLVFFGYQW